MKKRRLKITPPESLQNIDTGTRIGGWDFEYKINCIPPQWPQLLSRRPERGKGDREGRQVPQAAKNDRSEKGEERAKEERGGEEGWSEKKVSARPIFFCKRPWPEPINSSGKTYIYRVRLKTSYRWSG